MISKHTKFTMSWFWTLVFLTFTFSSCSSFSEANHRKKLSESLVLPSAVLVGTVHCDTCLPKPNHFIAGASVEVQCNVTNRGFRKEVRTNKHGEFQVHLPFFVTKHVKKLTRSSHCSIGLIRSNEASCPVPATAASSSLQLQSRKDGKHIFSAGVLSFKPQENCDHKKPRIRNLDEKKLSPNDNTDQLPFLPNPLNPPLLPPNPLLPPPSILPPLNPFQPPPSLIPPIFPTPPPSIFPPSLPLPLPPTPPFFNFPPLPGLVPSPPPPSPTFPIPLPPFPFQPTPGFPGVPPADVSSHSRTTSP